MDKKLMVINIIYAVTDTLVCVLAVVVFAYLAIRFGKWWISLFSMLPLLSFSSHSMVLNADIREARVDELRPKGGGDQDG